MNVGVTYNKKTKIGAVGPSVWAKLGPEDWFDNYKIVCANSREYVRDYIVDLNMRVDDVEKLTTGNIIASQQFQSVAKDLADYRFVMYKPAKVSGEVDQSRFIANPPSYGRFENKYVFRQLFTGKIPIPDYEVMELNELLACAPGEMYESLASRLGSKFVVQDESSGGGRGTFIIASINDLEDAIQVLRVERQGKYCIISRFVNGIERSIQAFVSADSFMPGPIQQQLVRSPDLLNPKNRGGMYFCGGRFITDAPQDVSKQIYAIAETVALQLRKEGYRGIFGLDFMLTEDGQIYTLEINARTTGLLPLLNEQRVEVPLYLLHILELAHEEYGILPSASRQMVVNGPSSFVVLFNQNDYSAYFDRTVTTGNYKVLDNELHKLDDEARWNPSADIMLQLFCSEDFPAKPNLKLCNIFLKDAGFDDHGTIKPDVRLHLQLLKSHIVSAD